jgi:2-dehydropantoate 2-reductase
MSICIYGAGAIGAWLGAKLALAGADVTLIARGPHLAAMQTSGVRIIEDDRELVARPRCVASVADAGQPETVIVTLKAHSLPAAVPDLQALMGPQTALVSAVNGIPWWYFHGLGGPYEGQRLDAVDPGGVIWDGIGPERAIGCVVYPAAEVVAPGVIRHLEGDRFTLGEPSASEKSSEKNNGKTSGKSSEQIGEKSARVLALSEVLRDAGLKAPVRTNLRNDIWIKLWGNLTFNPISALTHATLDEIATDDDTRGTARAMMLEAQAIGEAIGVSFKIDVDRRIAGAAAVGQHKTSMLQDLERGRPMEVEALLGAVREIGTMVDLPTPTIDVVLGLIRQRARAATRDV